MGGGIGSIVTHKLNCYKVMMINKGERKKLTSYGKNRKLSYYPRT